MPHHLKVQTLEWVLAAPPSTPKFVGEGLVPAQQFRATVRLRRIAPTIMFAPVRRFSVENPSPETDNPLVSRKQKHIILLFLSSMAVKGFYLVPRKLVRHTLSLNMVRQDVPYQLKKINKITGPTIASTK
ncbi:MAG: hypothetical protein A2060_02830 [Planctomycetes bacterium GWA2_50_13]|nr:MAG: hypothetical protein A2060_02830 [Planctomycetes bacterium GWA2_50_13]OHB95787.1 MAG: hypothetical protein A3I59_02705 [Planctomycetes bacterium RIFCSPLOWO2_02_FULL_50_16]OHC04859.1 MAG: hypothetical protein A3G17_05300 [Planctomycetes bacterium RIFCSPLOWO2_12_FULL_50_35]